MSRVWLALGIWLLFLVGGLVLVIRLHNMEHPNYAWEPIFIATIKERISAIRKILNSKEKKRKKRSR